MPEPMATLQQAPPAPSPTPETTPRGHRGRSAEHAIEAVDLVRTYRTPTGVFRRKPPFAEPVCTYEGAVNEKVCVAADRRGKVRVGR